MQSFRPLGKWIPLIVLSALVAPGALGSVSMGQETPRPSGFRALSGAEARNFVLPSDVRLAATITLSRYGLTLERYQQYVGPAQVLGGQLTLYRDASGTVVNVIGAHYPGLGPADRPPAPEPRPVPPLTGPADEVRLSDLMIHPDTGRRFYRVETRRFDSRWVEWIDAATGQVFNRYNALETNDGKGVKGDTKSMEGLTRLSGSDHSLYSADGRQKTLDALNCTSRFLCFLYDMLDADNHWLDERPNSPGQRAAVDAQFYANVVDDYYQTRHGFNWLTCTGLQAMKSVVHWQDKYNNAFWNGTYVVYGDGDQATTFRELSGGLDVAAHEYTHGVTGCTSKLDYQNEPGALNESFSDVMGNTVEFFADLLEVEFGQRL